MGSRVKEEEKIERTIRNLLKLQGNRRCINCNSLGPQYVCTTFLTFVCTNCSGVHREFTHRVKSVSMAKFTAEEVSALQAAGNERARQIYLKAWDPQRHFYPDCSNLNRLRDFIKHVYVDRKYTGEKSVNELPKLRLSDKDSSQQRRKVTPYLGGLQSLQGEMSISRTRKDHRSSIYYYDERSSPRYTKENSRLGGYGRSPTRIEVVDNRIRDDKPRNRKLSNEESKSNGQLSDSQENLEKSSPAVACNNKDTLGENEPPQSVGENVKTNKEMDAGVSDQDQNLVRANPVETKRDHVVSLIDFSTSPEPSSAAATSQTQPMPSSNDNGNWDAFKLTAEKNAPAAPVANSLEALLLELSVPSIEADSNLNDGPGKAVAPSTISGSTLPRAVAPDLIMGQTAPGTSIEASVAGSAENVQMHPSNLSQPKFTSNEGGGTASKNINGKQPPRMQPKHTCDYPFADTGLDSQLMAAAVVPNFEWTSSSESSAQGHLSASAEKVADGDSKPGQGSTTGVGSQPPSSEVNCGRKELPMDLFAVHYPPLPRTDLGWQSGTHRVMDYSLQYYPNTLTAAGYANPARPTNPFDLDNEKSRFYPQSALTGMPPSTGLIHTSSYQAPHSGAYMAQQVYGNTPSLRPQVVDDYGSNPSAFGSFHTNVHQSSGYPTALPNVQSVSPSFGSNPFG